MTLKIRVLVIEFNATGTRLGLDAESTNVKHKLLMSKYGHEFDVQEWRNAGLDDLARQMRQFKPHILHIRGHGSEEGPILRRITRSLTVSNDDVQSSESGAPRHLALTGAPPKKNGDNSTPQLLGDGSAHVLKNLLAEFSDLRCVLLLCCHSHSQAKEIAAEQCCTVGVQGAIDDSAAVLFTTEFFAALGDGESMGSAFRQAQYSVQNEYSKEAKRLHLLPEDEKPDELIFAGPQSTASSQPPAANLQSPFHITFPKNRRFQGRETELTALHELLQSGGSEEINAVGINSALTTQTRTADGSVAGVTGMGGIGKTQLAVEYAYRHRNDYPGGIFLINAAEPILPQLLDAARLLNLTVIDPERADFNEQLLTALRDYLHQHPKTLLIFDNVENPDLLLRTKFGPLTLPALGGTLLVTTRTRVLPQGMKPFSLDTLERDPDAAKAIITNARPDLADDGKLDDLCERMGYLPLVLNLAAAALKINQQATIQSYLDKLAEWGAERLHARVSLEDHEARSLTPVLAAQWQILNEMDAEGANARQIFAIAGQLGEATFIPIARLGLLANLQDDPDGWESPLADAITQLYNLHLVEILDRDDETGMDAVDNGASPASVHPVILSPLHQIRLHPLVRDFAEMCTPAEERTTFRNGCASHVADAYSDLQRVVDEIHARGVAEVQEDLLVALTLADPQPPPTPPTAGGEYDGRAHQQLQTLNRLLQREAHSLRKGSTPTHLAQQLAYRVADRGINALKTSAQRLLVNAREALFNRTWSNRGESVAVERTLTGHGSRVMSVAVCDEGRIAVSASYDHTLKIWNLVTGEEERILHGHESRVVSVSVYDGGHRAISASHDKTLRVWNLATGEQKCILCGHESRVMSVAVYDEGRKAISSSLDKTLRVWNLVNGEEERVLFGHEGGVRAATVYNNGNNAISASDDQTLKVWNLITGIEEQTLRGHEASVRAVVVYEDDRKVISASSDKTLKVWNLATGEEEQTLRGHGASVHALAVYEDDRKVISASSDKTLKVWNLATGEEEQTLRGHESHVRSVIIADKISKVISASDDKSLKLWKLPLRIDKITSNEHILGVMSIEIFDEGRKVISASADCTLKIWDLRAGMVERTLVGHQRCVMSVMVFDEGRKAITAADDMTIKVWDLVVGEERQSLLGHERWIRSVKSFYEGRKAISASDDNTLKVWDLNTNQSERTLVGHTNWVRDVEVFAKGHKAISASSDTTLKVWDLATGEEEQTLVGHNSSVMAVKIFDKGRKAISASHDKTINVWNLKTGMIEQTLTGHKLCVTSILLFNKDCRAISASYDRMIKVWDLETGQEVASIVLDGAIVCIAVHEGNDGVTVVAGDQNGGVYCLRYVEP